MFTVIQATECNNWLYNVSSKVLHRVGKTWKNQTNTIQYIWRSKNLLWICVFFCLRQISFVNVRMFFLRVWSYTNSLPWIHSQKKTFPTTFSNGKVGPILVTVLNWISFVCFYENIWIWSTRTLKYASAISEFFGDFTLFTVKNAGKSYDEPR